MCFEYKLRNWQFLSKINIFFFHVKRPILSKLLRESAFHAIMEMGCCGEDKICRFLQTFWHLKQEGSFVPLVHRNARSPKHHHLHLILLGWQWNTFQMRIDSRCILPCLVSNHKHFSLPMQFLNSRKHSSRKLYNTRNK